MGQLFAQLDLEDAVQIGDKTRFSIEKSFAAKGTTAITTATLKPARDHSGGAFSVFDADTENRYTDWVYADFSTDVGSYNEKIHFNEGGDDLLATVAAGSYTMAQLCTAIKTALEAAGDLTYTVTQNDDSFTIAATGSFELKVEGKSNSLLKQIGFDLDTSSGTSHEADHRAEYVMREVLATVGNGADSATATKAIKVYSEAGDRLFSDDNDLLGPEPGIFQWCPKGRSTFLTQHREAQQDMLNWLDIQGYTDTDGNRLTKWNVTLLDEVRQWAKYCVLRIIFSGVQNAKDDVFESKRKNYSTLEAVYRNRAILRLDLDKDGKADVNEGPSIQSGSIWRR